MQIQQRIVQNAIRFTDLLLQQLQLLTSTVVMRGQNQIQIIGTGVDNAERLAQFVYQDTHHRPDFFLHGIGGEIGRA
jgi:hypothetical protein